MREVRISCPDATGLGVDIARMLLDFGLRIIRGDISTDGKWCFIIFKVCLSSGACMWPHRCGCVARLQLENSGGWKEQSCV